MKQIAVTNAVPVHTCESISYSTQIQPPLPALRCPQIFPAQRLPEMELHAANDQPRPNFALMCNVAYRNGQEPATETARARNEQDVGDEGNLERNLRGINRQARPILVLTGNIAYGNGEDMENEGSIVDSDGYEQV